VEAIPQRHHLPFHGVVKIQFSSVQFSKENIMGYFKSLSIDTDSLECETLPYPTATNYTAPSVVYGLFADGRLVDLYSLKDTADYECYLCKMGDDAIGASTQYQVLPIKVFNHSPFTELEAA